MTTITFTIPQRVRTYKEKLAIADKLAMSLTLNMLEVKTVIISGTLYSLEAIRKDLSRYGYMTERDTQE